MASLSSAWILRVFYVFLASNGLVYGLSSLIINATSVKVGYLWDNPRQENVDTSEVIMDSKHSSSILRLICDISPPLPNDEEHWEKRDALVNWYKVGPKTEEVKGIRYWSSDLTKTAISFSNVTLDTLGIYSCNYGDISATIGVLVANVEAAKTLKTPGNLTELHTYVSYMKDKSGIDGWTQQQHLLQPIGTKEFCPALQSSHQTARTVHQLQPSDIKIIAAMGDAFTVGLGARATSINGYFTEYKDISWSIGGGNYLNKTTTIPNIIRQFSPSLKGASAKTSENEDSFDADLNVAFLGASARDLENQAKDLVSKLKAVKDIDYENDWKLLTIWIGTEDLCLVCKDADKYGAGSFIKYMMRTLKYLQHEVPRLFVNIVPPMDVSSLYELHEQDTQSCQILGWNSCECLKEGDAEKSKLAKEARQYKYLLEELVNSGLYGTKDSFTVVIQPALQMPPKTKSGDMEKSYFGVDCLHFSVHGHAAAALALWKNMLEPLGSKTKQWGDQETLACPSKDKPYLFTKTNSKLIMSDFTDNGDDEDGSSSGDFPPVAAVALAVSLTAVLVIVFVLVWRGRKSRRRPEASRLLYAPGPHKPRI